MSIILAHTVPKNLASKSTQYSPPHLTRVATLPENTSASEIGTLFFLWVCCSEKIVEWFDQLITEEFQYSLKFQRTDSCVCLRCTFATEQEFTNKVTFSAMRAVHGLTLPGRRQLNRRLELCLAASIRIPRSLHILHGNSCSSSFIHSFIHCFFNNVTWQNAVDNKKKYKHATWSI